MSQIWFPILILLACIVLNFTAFRATGSLHPDHPLVERHSPKSRKFFAVAAVTYAVSLAIIMAKHDAWVIAAALAAIGMLFTLLGSHGSKK